MDKQKLLFVCLGNICRSPAAHAVMQALVDEEGYSSHIWIDSAGVANYHIGELPDRRMRSHGAKRGYDVSHRARQFDSTKDFQEFDLILVMDRENYEDVVSQAHSQEERQKVHYLAEYLEHHPEHHVIPDPYYGGAEGFELVLDLLEDACKGLLDNLMENNN